jgi:hypothetical protein
MSPHVATTCVGTAGCGMVASMAARRRRRGETTARPPRGSVRDAMKVYGISDPNAEVWLRRHPAFRIQLVRDERREGALPRHRRLDGSSLQDNGQVLTAPGTRLKRGSGRRASSRDFGRGAYHLARATLRPFGIYGMPDAWTFGRNFWAFPKLQRCFDRAYHDWTKDRLRAGAYSFYSKLRANCTGHEEIEAALAAWGPKEPGPDFDLWEPERYLPATLVPAAQCAMEIASEVDAFLDLPPERAKGARPVRDTEPPYLAVELRLHGRLARRWGSIEQEGDIRIVDLVQDDLLAALRHRGAAHAADKLVARFFSRPGSPRNR